MQLKTNQEGSLVQDSVLLFALAPRIALLSLAEVNNVMQQPAPGLATGSGRGRG